MDRRQFVTVAGAVIGMRFTRQGQSCTAASRIFVHESLHDAFVDKLKAKVDAMKMGDPLDEQTDIGIERNGVLVVLADLARIGQSDEAQPVLQAHAAP